MQKLKFLIFTSKLGVFLYFYKVKGKFEKFVKSSVELDKQFLLRYIAST